MPDSLLLDGVDFAAAGHPALSRARVLSCFLAEQSPRNEAQGRLCEDTVAAVTDADMFSLIVPAFVGGHGATPVEALQVLEEVSAADGSTGWVLMAAGLAMGSAAAFLPESGVQKLFRDGRIPVMAGQGAPNGKLVAVDGGYRLTGKWTYGSGIKHAAYVFTGAMIVENGVPKRNAEGRPETRMCVVPRSEARLDDNWDVIGLRGTGSVDYTIDDVFVPEDCTFAPLTARPAHDDAFYRVGLFGVAALGHTAFALGVGRRALDEINRIAATKAGPAGRLADSESFRENYALNEAKFRSARSFVFETWSGIQANLDRGAWPTTREVTLLRLALNFITSTALDVCLFAYKAGGGVSLRESAVQRCFRDMCAGAQHFHVSVSILRDCGTELLGLADGKRWESPGLVSA